MQTMGMKTKQMSDLSDALDGGALRQTGALPAPAAWLASRFALVRRDIGAVENAMPEVLRERYVEQVDRGQIEPDPAQEALLHTLEGLSAALASYRPARKAAALGWLFGARANAAPPMGAYIWGAVGRGKTMLMDLFFEETQQRHKKRQHFNAFMADVHARIFAIRQQMKKGLLKGDDPIAPVAEAIADEAFLICLDEFNVTDIADAMILGRLFQHLFQRGVVIVATSNVAPEELYKDGLNRALFLPFIALLRQKMQVLNLAARTDFRLEKLRGESVYHTPADATAEAALTRAFAALTGTATAPARHLEVLGHDVFIPQAKAHVARFGFKDLCVVPLGPRDFLAIAENFHTVIVDAIPIIRAEERDVARRFILLIDALYDQHVKLIASAAAEPAALYLATSGREAFEFARTASRLIEMRSAPYLGLPHGSVASLGSGATTGLVET
jgi:cell division protein ZapE